MSGRSSRIISLSVLPLFILTQVVCAQLPEKTFWENRRSAARLRQSGTDPPPSSPRRNHDFELDKGDAAQGSDALGSLVSLISRHGTVQHIQRGPIPGPFLLHVQDVHGHPQAQKNIALIVSEILKAHPLAPVGLEGAEAKDIDLVPFRGPSVEANGEVGHFFFNAGYLTGAELPAFTAITTPRYFGLEDPELYGKNVSAVRAALVRQAHWQTKLSHWTEVLKNSKEELFSPSLKELDRIVCSYEEGRLPLKNFLSVLGRGSPPAVPDLFPQVTLFLRVVREEHSLPLSRVNQEQKDILSEVVDVLSPGETRALLDRAVLLRRGEISAADFYRDLPRWAARAGIPLERYPSLNDYIRYVLAADSIDPYLLLSEVKRLEQRRWAALLKTAAQRDLYTTDQNLKMARHLIDLSLMPAEWSEFVADRQEQVRSLPNRFGEETAFWRADLARFEAFYEKAVARDRALAQAILDRLPSAKSPSDVIVFVAGGFHADGMAEILKGHGTLISLSPKLGAAVQDEVNPLAVFTRETLPLDALFDASLHSLSDTPALSPLGDSKKAVRSLAGRLEKLVQQVFLSGSPALEESGGVRIKCSPFAENVTRDPTREPPLLAARGEKTIVEFWASPHNGAVRKKTVVGILLILVMAYGVLNGISEPNPLGPFLGVLGISGFHQTLNALTHLTGHRAVVHLLNHATGMTEVVAATIKAVRVSKRFHWARIIFGPVHGERTVSAWLDAVSHGKEHVDLLDSSREVIVGEKHHSVVEITPVPDDGPTEGADPEVVSRSETTIASHLKNTFGPPRNPLSIPPGQLVGEWRPHTDPWKKYMGFGSQELSVSLYGNTIAGLDSAGHGVWKNEHFTLQLTDAGRVVPLNGVSPSPRARLAEINVTVEINHGRPEGLPVPVARVHHAWISLGEEFLDVDAFEWDHRVGGWGRNQREIKIPKGALVVSYVDPSLGFLKYRIFTPDGAQFKVRVRPTVLGPLGSLAETLAWEGAYPSLAEVSYDQFATYFLKGNPVVQYVNLWRFPKAPPYPGWGITVFHGRPIAGGGFELFTPEGPRVIRGSNGGGSWFGNPLYKKTLAWVETAIALWAGYALATVLGSPVVAAFGWTDPTVLWMFLSGGVSALIFWAPHVLLGFTPWGNSGFSNDPTVRRLTWMTSGVGALGPLVGPTLFVALGTLLTGHHFFTNQPSVTRPHIVPQRNHRPVSAVFDDLVRKEKFFARQS
jgi:hypothetical protein